MHKIHNFCAGPSDLPKDVATKLIMAMENFENSGIPLYAVSHRDDRFFNMVERSKALLRELLEIPNNYQILFFHSGATMQFYSIAENLKYFGEACYLDCGYWSKVAITEARKLIDVEVIEKDYNKLFFKQDFNLVGDYDYVHYTDNETIDGREFQYIPETKNIPLVCDMSSNLLSRWFDVSRYGLIYAGAQKNLGISGVTLVIIRDDLINKRDNVASVQSYYQALKKDSMVNTPATVPWYGLYLMLEWLKEQGGIKKIESINQEKSKAFYDYLDQSETFKAVIPQSIRSRMNVVFTRKDENKGKIDQLIKSAEMDGFYGINGHRSVGGLRASLYNAVKIEAVFALIDYLKEHEARDR